jgi:Domain of unknown function (DUF397)
MTIHDAQVTAAAQWRKSSYSTAGNNCVEVAQAAGGCAVRDSKNPDGGHLIFGAQAWEAFVTDVKQGRYDDL